MRAAILAVLAAALTGVHPLHTTHTDLTEEDGGRVAVVVRAFTDDLHAAVRRHEGAEGDSAMARYARSEIQLAGRDGHPVVLRWVGSRREGEITLLTLSAVLPNGLTGATIRQQMHMEQFSDQVNVVQASYGGHHISLLCLPGDGARRLP
jgi:Domain of unknown function (DUF6702)